MSLFGFFKFDFVYVNRDLFYLEFCIINKSHVLGFELHRSNRNHLKVGVINSVLQQINLS